MAEEQLDSNDDGDRLKGWKEIAVCLRTSERTAQRWEDSLRLPVHRIVAAGNAIVFASRRELAGWLESRDVQKALSEDADAERVSAAGVQSEAPAESDGGAWTPDTPGESAASPVIAERSFGHRGPIGRPFPWPLLAVVAVACVVGIMTFARSLGWSWATSERAVTAPTESASSASATSPAAGSKLTTVSVRLTLDNGTSVGAGIPVGDTAMWAVKGRPSYVLSASLVEGGAWVHVSQFESKDAQGAPRLTELAIVMLRPGERVTVANVAGLAAIEWIKAGASNTDRQGSRG